METNGRPGAARDVSPQGAQNGNRPIMTSEAILAAIPHRPPFLLVDEIVGWEPERIVCRKRFEADEYFFSGHYPGRPIVPGVLLCEAAMQAGAVLLSRHVERSDETLPVATRMNDVRFKRMVFPGETIEIEVTLTERLGSAFFLQG